MAIQFTCECGKEFSAPDRKVGQMGICPVCEREIAIPGDPAENPMKAVLPDRTNHFTDRMDAVSQVSRLRSHRSRDLTSVDSTYDELLATKSGNEGSEVNYLSVILFLFFTVISIGLIIGFIAVPEKRWIYAGIFLILMLGASSLAIRNYRRRKK